MQHVVTQPHPPFLSANGALRVHQVPAWMDNLIWVLECTATKVAAFVDGPDAGDALAYCKAQGLTPRVVLNTHTHPDHVGINRDLEKRGLLAEMTVIGPAGDAERVPGLSRGVSEGDTVRVGRVEGRVLLTEGHLNGHISFVFDDVLFCGDTLFGAGCGYLFDGPPSKMHHSLQTLAALPPETRVCCAHEYTEDNLRFAWSVEPGNAALAERIRDAWRVRATGGCTIPSTVGLEQATNPFVRSDSEEIRTAVASAMQQDLATPERVFAATRALKDRKDYKKLEDTALPL